MNENNGALEFEALLNNKKFLAAVAQNEKAVRGMSDDVVKGGAKMDSAFKGLGGTLSGLIGPVSALTAALQLKKWAQDAYEFESAFGMAMREVQTISRAVQEDFEGISDAIVQMAANGPESAINLAKAFYQIVSAGYDGQEGLRLLEISTKAATAGITDTTTAADGLTTVLNAWGLGLEQADKVADTMFKTVERGKTTFGELASAIAQVAPLAASNNIAFEEIFAAIQSITKQGTPTAQAMTQIRSSIINMNKVLGDGWSSVMSYQDGLNKVATMAGGSQNKLKELIPDVEGVNAVLALTGKKAAGAAEDLNETAKAAGAMEKAYSTMMEEADSTWSLVHNKWTRELRDLGKALKEESGSVASFFDAILSRGEDIKTDMSIYGIADRIKALRIMGGSKVGSWIKGGLFSDNSIRDQYGEFVNQIKTVASDGLAGQQIKLGDILKIEDKDVRLEALTEFLKDIKEAETDLGEVQFRNDEQQRAALTLRAKLWGEVSEKAQAAINAMEESGGGGGSPETTIRTLKNMLDELKTAQDNLGTGSMQDDIETLTRISILQKEIAAYYEKIREARKVESGDRIKPMNVNLGGVQSVTKEQAKQELQTTKLIQKSEKLRTGAQQRADAIKEQNDRYLKQEALIESLQTAFGDTSEILGAMSYAVGQIDEGIGETLGKMADIAYNAEGLVSNLGEGGSTIAAVSSGIAIVGTIAGGIMRSIVTEEELIQQKAESVRQMFELQNIQLREQLKILEGSTGEKRVKEEQKTLELIRKQTEEAQKQAAELELRVKKTEKSGFLNLGRTTTTITLKGSDDVEEWIDRLDDIEGWAKRGFTIENLDELNQLIDEYNALIEARRELYEELTQTTSGNIADTISDGFFEGKRSLEDFSQDFEQLMKNALKNTLKAQYLNAVSKEFFESFGTMAEGGFTADEIKQIGSEWGELVTGATTEFDKLAQALKEAGIDINDSAASGIAGQIGRAITEDTASELAGLWNRTALDTRSIRDYSRKALDNLAAIQLNTANTVLELRNAVNRLDRIVENTESTDGRI